MSVLASTGQASNSLDDLVLRPPLFFQLHPSCDEQHDDELVRPMICRMFIAAHTLRLRNETRFCAVVLWHRYVAAMSSANQTETKDKDDMMAWAAAACLFLACKAEEEPRRMRDIINVTHMFLKEQREQPTTTKANEESLQSASMDNSAGDKKVAANQEDKDSIPPTNSTTSNIVLHVSQNPPHLDDQYWESKEVLVRVEQTVLRWLGFDVSVSKPQRAVSILLQEPKIRKDVLQRWSLSHDQLVPIALRRLNDALFYSKALSHSTMALAVASIELAIEEISPSTQLKEEASVACPWWLMVEVSGAALAAAKKDLQAATDAIACKKSLSAEST